MSNEPAYSRRVYCQDALQWLKNKPIFSDCSLVTSLPDISEFPGYSLEKWKEWFTQTATLILNCTPPSGVSIFYQTDIKFEGSWVDKGYLCQKAAESVQHNLLWHKIVCRAPSGQATFGRPGYTHLLCFSKNLLSDLSKSTADVIHHLGDRTWERGMGIEACLLIAKFIAGETSCQTVVNPFCGQGSMLAAANAFGLSAIGIERSRKRAVLASSLQIDLRGKKWIKNIETAPAVLEKTE